MLASNKSDINDITVTDSDSIPYFPMEDASMINIEILKNLLEERKKGELDDDDKLLLHHLYCE